MGKITAQERADIEALVHEHAWRIDMCEAETLAELYTATGRLLGTNGVGLNCANPEEITAYGIRASARRHMTVRHVCSNLRLVRESDTVIRGTLMIGLCRSETPLGDPTPIALADAYDIYHLCADGEWRLEERRLSLAFEAPAHRAAPSKPEAFQAG